MQKKEKLSSQNLRKVAGGFPTGVTIITTESKGGNIIGMTASSFVSVSLNPALVAFFIMDNASMMKKLKIGTKVSISILSEDQKNISNQFAGLNKDEVEINYDSHNKYHKIKNALAWYETKIDTITRVGDHFMVVCKVLDLERNDQLNPLIYYSGYRGVGSEV